jgi:hypothetical protein
MLPDARREGGGIGGAQRCDHGDPTAKALAIVSIGRNSARLAPASGREVGALGVIVERMHDQGTQADLRSA